MNDLSEADYIELETTVFELLNEELNEYSLQYASKSFYQNLVYDLSDLLLSHWYEDHDEDDVHYFMYMIIMSFFQVFLEFPHRSYVEYNEVLDIYALARQIQNLRAIEQPAQRTDEWYAFRNNLLTASNIWKVFGTESQRNSLIYEKCKCEQEKRIFNLSMQWGNIFEPLSIKIYELKYNTTIEDYGCIPHPNYPFIGASPDGINIDPESEKFGRMLEVKNIYNREIDGIPKDEYWIQMQIQMETCDLDICDFLETRFLEYETLEAYNAGEHEYKGIVLCFIKGYNEDMKYLYKPLSMVDNDIIGEWAHDQCAIMHRLQYSYTRTIYWYLDEFSCVTVTRNHRWFKKALPLIEEVYNIIQHEKVNGFEHRAPKKPRKTASVTVSQHETSDSQLIHNLTTDRQINLVKLESETANF